MDLRASEDVKKPMALPSPFHSVPCADPSLDESNVPLLDWLAAVEYSSVDSRAGLFTLSLSLRLLQASAQEILVDLADLVHTVLRWKERLRMLQQSFTFSCSAAR